MNIEKDYERLYQHWRDELERVELTPLSKELINYYNNNFQQLKDYQKSPQSSIKDQLLDAYKENFKFLIEDFLKLREIKIINAALALKEIDFNNTLEAEKLFYQKLISSFKGFQKMRTFTMYDDVGAEEITLDIKIANEKTESAEQIIPSIQPSPTKIYTDALLQSKENVDYTLIRFIKEAPPLVGVDIINYGPFKKEDIAFLPAKNAKILITEKFAEEINIS